MNSVTNYFSQASFHVNRFNKYILVFVICCKYLVQQSDSVNVTWLNHQIMKI